MSLSMEIKTNNDLFFKTYYSYDSYDSYDKNDKCKKAFKIKIISTLTLNMHKN